MLSAQEYSEGFIKMQVDQINARCYTINHDSTLVNYGYRCEYEDETGDFYYTIDSAEVMQRIIFFTEGNFGLTKKTFFLDENEELIMASVVVEKDNTHGIIATVEETVQRLEYRYYYYDGQPIQCKVRTAEGLKKNIVEMINALELQEIDCNVNTDFKFEAEMIRNAFADIKNTSTSDLSGNDAACDLFMIMR